jgi:hypothetical protein
MKQLIIALCLFGQVQAQEFMGIKVDGSKQHITSQFIAKGFKKKTELPTTIVYSGELNGSKIEVYATFTPKTNKCWKFSVWMPEETSWYTLKSKYEKYVSIFTEKYGKPDSDYAMFLTPYYEGDGYEMSAVSLEKCLYSSFWGEKYAVEISKYKQIKIHYENPTNSKLFDQEKKQVDNTIF